MIVFLLQLKFGKSQQTVNNLKCYKCIAKYVRRPDVACGGTTSSADDVIFIDITNLIWRHNFIDIRALCRLQKLKAY